MNTVSPFTSLLGVDENGLGPLMGPLVVTGVLAEGAVPDHWPPGIEDSKRFFKSGSPVSFRRLEKTVLSFHQSAFGGIPAGPRPLIEALCGGIACAETASPCRDRLPTAFTVSPEERGETASAFARWSRENGFRIKGIRCAVLCPKELNRRFSLGSLKSDVDLRLFGGIIAHFRRDGLDVAAGKIGGMKNYGDRLRCLFPGEQIAAGEETDAVSRYRFSGGGADWRLSFHLDVEEKSLPACMASLVGKYVREVFMESILETLSPGERVSGYRDVRTKAFLARRPFPGVRNECLVRTK